MVENQPICLEVLVHLHPKKKSIQMVKHILIFSAALLTSLTTVQAQVRLPHVISDNMVIQQDTDVRLWGWDKPNKTVKVTTSWSQDAVTTRAGKDGKWEVKVRSPKASYTPLIITFDDGKPVSVKNVVAGEVWVCAGQSNMQFPIKGFPNCPLEGYADVVAEANQYSQKIRYCKIPDRMSMTPLEDTDCDWKVTDMNTVADQSAVGYFFARYVSNVLNIPVGLVEANKGGSRVEGWLNEENVKKYTTEPLDSTTMANQYTEDWYRPMVWGNGTFSPIQKYTVKGILFYQGCSNVDYHMDKYADRLAVLVKQWRDGFGEGDIPFYFVQIASYGYNQDVNGTSSAFIREQQLKAADLIPNSGLVCTNDLTYPYERQQIHPCKKKPVGERLANFALNRDYGFKSVLCESPRYKEMFIQNDTCYVSLDNTYGGISRFDDIEGFEVAGSDHVFHKAVAGHFWVPGDDKRNETIFVTSPEVKHPVAVRYCFRNVEQGNLMNNANLPLFPFRTDNWNE